jgi:acyl-CoA reductase-like NAD-dependent aldehyde dehydrogenase
MMLQRAHWAASAFASYPPVAVARICEALAEAGYENAQRYAEWAVRETGMGQVEHKRIKNEICSRGILQAYRGRDYVSVKVYSERKVVEVPRPAGVIFALTPSTNPVSTVYFKVLLALMTRNTIVLSPHPLARGCCVDAVRLLAAAAVRAGAPDGSVQVVEQPSVPLIEALMSDPVTDVILATGGVAVVRAAYGSGNPAIGVGPGNVPALVDASADIGLAAQRLIDSKSFDNSVLCTAESAAIAEESIADRLLEELRAREAHVCSPEEADRVRNALFRDGQMRPDLIGKDAVTLAAAAGVKAGKSTRVLVAPFEMVIPEEPLAREKLFPLLGLTRAGDARRGIDAACAMLRIGGAGHSAAIHSSNPRSIMAYGSAVRVLRVAVNVGSSTGAAGFDTNLAPTMTIGTGFFGRSSVGDNLAPEHLVNWTRIAHVTGPAEPFGPYVGLDPWSADLPQPSMRALDREVGERTTTVREELRAAVLSELRELVRS